MTIYSGFSHEKWWFSIAMLVYQRVSPTKAFEHSWWREKAGVQSTPWYAKLNCWILIYIPPQGKQKKTLGAQPVTTTNALKARPMPTTILGLKQVESVEKCRCFSDKMMTYPGKNGRFFRETLKQDDSDGKFGKLNQLKWGYIKNMVLKWVTKGWATKNRNDQNV